MSLPPVDSEPKGAISPPPWTSVDNARGAWLLDASTVPFAQVMASAVDSPERFAANVSLLRAAPKLLVALHDAAQTIHLIGDHAEHGEPEHYHECGTVVCRKNVRVLAEARGKTAVQA